jgi:hypothetical protein
MRSSFDRRVRHRRGYDGQQKGTICDARGSYEARFSPSTIDSLYLRVTDHEPRCRDLVILVRTTDDR